MEEPGSEHFHVVYTGIVRDQVAALAQNAAKRGVQRDLATALRSIQGRLRNDPLTWGESSRNLAGLGITLVVGFHARMAVRFAVDEQRQLVYVQSIEPLSGSPFEPPS